MKTPRITLLLLTIAIASIVGLQKRGLAQNASSLRIIAPANAQKIATDFVQVRYQLLNPALAGSPSPTFQLQLDGGDPIRTTSTSYTFTGLSPGQHTVLISLVDANNTPIPGATNAVQFIVLPAAQPRSATPGETSSPAPQPAMRHLREAALPTTQAPLPDTGSALPLLSVIGFGVLLGGIASALKTR